MEPSSHLQELWTGNTNKLRTGDGDLQGILESELEIPYGITI